jgi:predicted nucleic acid-binding protein
MRAVVLVDTGPLVALLDPSDRARDRCRRALSRLEGKELVTTEAVITEAEYLPRRRVGHGRHSLDRRA